MAVQVTHLNPFFNKQLDFYCNRLPSESIATNGLVLSFSQIHVATDGFHGNFHATIVDQAFSGTTDP